MVLVIHQNGIDTFKLIWVASHYKINGKCAMTFHVDPDLTITESCGNVLSALTIVLTMAAIQEERHNLFDFWKVSS
jgi:hypothetical protein